MAQPKAKHENSPLTPRFVANDNGYAAHKVAWYDSEGKIQTTKVSSHISVGSGNWGTASGDKQVNAYAVDDVNYSCQGTQNLIDLRNGQYPTSVHNRVLNTHALSKAGLLGQPVRLAVTLPFRDYFQGNGMLNVELRDRTANNFTMPVQVSGSEAQPDIRSCNVYAEALSGWFDWALDDNGEMREEAASVKEEMAVIDIGGSTTDICAVRLEEDGALLINHDTSGTKKVGVLDAREYLNELIRERMVEKKVFESGHDNNVPAWFIEIILKNGRGTYYGQEWEMEDLRQRALKANAEQIVNFIKSSLGNLGHYQVIVIIGGGAIVYREVLQKAFPMASFGDEFSNAKGAVKYLRGLQSFEG